MGGEALRCLNFFKENSFLKGSLIAAVIWYLYHCPLIMFADYNSGVEKPFVLICFAFSILSITFIANKLRVRVDSVWPAVLLHGSHNLFIQSIFDKITIDKGIKQSSVDFHIVCKINLLAGLMHFALWYKLLCLIV